MVALADTDITDVPVTANANALFNAHLGLARKIARHHGARYGWLADDFESDALLTLWAAATRFDPALAGGRGFASFARLKIRHALIDRVRRERARNPLAFRPQVPTAEPGGTTDPISLAYDRHDDTTEVDFLDVLALFPPDRRDAMRRLSIGGESFAEVAAGQGVSAWTVRERMKADAERVKAKLAG